MQWLLKKQRICLKAIMFIRMLNWKHVMKLNLEKYIKKVQIEARIMGELATSHILPAAIRYQNVLIENIKGLKEAGT